MPTGGDLRFVSRWLWPPVRIVPVTGDCRGTPKRYSQAFVSLPFWPDWRCQPSAEVISISRTPLPLRFFKSLSVFLLPALVIVRTACDCFQIIQPEFNRFFRTIAFNAIFHIFPHESPISKLDNLCFTARNVPT